MDAWHPDMTFDRDLVVVGLEAGSSDEVIRALGDRLCARGYVTGGFAESVIKREREYPTGLPTTVPVALPHTEAGFCLRSALAVGVMKSPVKFQEMGNPQNTLEARAVFLLALANPKDQVRWLQRFMRGLRNASLLERLTKAATEDEAAGLVDSMLELESPRGVGARSDVEPKEETV